jgi:hypothetical protein
VELLHRQVLAWLDVVGLGDDHVHGGHVLSDGDGEVVHGLQEDRFGLGKEDGYTVRVARASKLKLELELIRVYFLTNVK